MIPIPANLCANTLMLPFKSTLYPIQKNLRKRVLHLRIATSICYMGREDIRFLDHNHGLRSYDGFLLGALGS